VRRSQEGVALVLVIWLATLLMVVASSFLYASRSDALVVRNSVSIARAEAIADAAVFRAIYDVNRVDAGSTTVWKRDGVANPWSFDGAQVSVEVRDESAKIDINTASDPLLKGLLLSLGLPEEEAAPLLDAILDWRDPDSLKRINGAEESDYKAAGLAYRPANAQFQAIEELQLVLGMRPEIYRRMAPLITVYSRQNGINPATASREVLSAIPNLPAEAIDRFLGLREEARRQRLPVPFFPEAGAFASPASALVTSVRAHVVLDDGTVFVRDAVAMVKPGGRRLVTPLVWRQSPAPPPPTSDPAAEAAPQPVTR
jgi:general secretion pathway protein K